MKKKAAFRKSRQSPADRYPLSYIHACAAAPTYIVTTPVTTSCGRDFFLICVYVPNSGSELARLGYRQKWDADFLAYLKNLERTKPVIVCGDFNVAHKPMDLARPKENYNKSAGFMQEEIDGMTNFLANDFVDSFREKHPEAIKYTWWSYRAGARQKNVGWRIDYFLVSNSLKHKIEAAFILNEVLGSDHCPVGIML